MCLIPAFGAIGPHLRRLLDGVYATNCVSEELGKMADDKDPALIGQWIKVVYNSDNKVSYFDKGDLYCNDGYAEGTMESFNGPLIILRCNKPEIKIWIDAEFAASWCIHEWYADPKQTLMETLQRGYSFKRYLCTKCCAWREEYCK